LKDGLNLSSAVIGHKFLKSDRVSAKGRNITDIHVTFNKIVGFDTRQIDIIAQELLLDFYIIAFQLRIVGAVP